ncbi:hypothetical protein [Amaricoccus sp.]|nr:hypothetical protein [Amaricoccus sp.]MBP7000420.1 hypothetical protein [Amaricoccus sp.]
MIVRRIHKSSRARRAWNATIHPVRCRIEKTFGTSKRSHGPERAPIRGH